MKRYDDYAAEIVRDWPPLTLSQKADIREIFNQAEARVDQIEDPGFEALREVSGND